MYIGTRTPFINIYGLLGDWRLVLPCCSSFRVTSSRTREWKQESEFRSTTGVNNCKVADVELQLSDNLSNICLTDTWTVCQAVENSSVMALKLVTCTVFLKALCRATWWPEPPPAPLFFLAKLSPHFCRAKRLEVKMIPVSQVSFLIQIVFPTWEQLIFVVLRIAQEQAMSLDK